MYFRNNYAFLSNMFPCELKINGLTFSCAEAAFQSFKTTDLEIRKTFQNIDGYEAKKLGRTIDLRDDWNEIRLEVMDAVLRVKFKQHPNLFKQLKEIDEPIVEDNNWNDTFWGRCNNKGSNNLGMLLERIKYMPSPKIHTIHASLLEAKQQHIAHVVNCKGVMGAGVARNIKATYPQVFKTYQQACTTVNTSKDLLGVVQGVAVPERTVFNMFAQDTYGYKGQHLNYSAFKTCCKKINAFCKKHNIKEIAMPYGIGCGLAGGDWDTVLKIITECFDIDIYLYRI